MIQDDLPFAGLFFFEGVEHLPGDLMPNLGTIREWANSKGMISAPKFQLIGPDRIRDIFRVFSPDDKLLIAISISGHPEALNYMEHPYVPVRTLIRRSLPIRLVYWSVHPSRWDANGTPLAYGEARFGFWVSDCEDEFCSSSNAKLVVPKFVALFDSVNDKFSPVKTKPDGTWEVTGEGVYIAEFRKIGRQFDIDIRHAEQHG
ncbi:MAG: hypothetical protein D4R58_02615 [Betaproteobacteria bacterium]|nr:MAG: hypothetical protein D4R58_02615 [Betaproteobacteria bacterium]